MHVEFNYTTNQFICSHPEVCADGPVSVYFSGDLTRNNKNRLRKLLTGRERFQVIRGITGHFILAVYDSRQREVLVARDHFGQEPVYYSNQDGQLLFGTTLEGVRSKSGRCEVNEAVLHEYLMFRYIAGEDTFFKGTRMLKPGNMMTVKNEGQISFSKFYEFNYEPQSTVPEASYEQIFQDAFLEVLQDQASDWDEKRNGILSSGGIDSSIIVSALSTLKGSGTATYFIGNKDYEHNRTDDVNKISQIYDTRQTNYFFGSEDFADSLVDTLKINEDPLNHPSTVLVNLLYKKLQHDIDVLYTGEGADCFFCGYYVFDLIRWGYVHNPFSSVTQKLFAGFPQTLIPQSYKRKAARILNSLSLPAEEFSVFNDLLVFNSKEQSRKIIQSRMPSDFGKKYYDFFNGYNRSDILNRVLKVYQSYYITEAFVSIAKLGRAYGIVHRHPFVDARLIDRFNRFPWKSKIQFFKRKHHVVELGKQYLPEEFFSKSKEGFGVPLVNWFYNNNGLGRFIELLTESRTRQRGLFNVTELDAMLDRYHRKEISNEAFESSIWIVINLELWYRINVDGKIENY